MSGTQPAIRGASRCNRATGRASATCGPSQDKSINGPATTADSSGGIPTMPIAGRLEPRARREPGHQPVRARRNRRDDRTAVQRDQRRQGDEQPVRRRSTVDNVQPAIALSTANDGNPSVWVNHAVILDASAHAAERPRLGELQRRPRSRKAVPGRRA